MFAIWRKSGAYYLPNITEGETEVVPDNQVIDRSRKKDQLENWGVGDGDVFIRHFRNEKETGTSWLSQRPLGVTGNKEQIGQ